MKQTYKHWPGYQAFTARHNRISTKFSEIAEHSMLISYSRIDCAIIGLSLVSTTHEMPAPRRKLQATVQETLTPPDELKDSQSIAKIKGAAGNNLYNVELPGSRQLLVELDPRFRSTIWLKRGGFVLVDTATLAERDNKINGEIINVVRDEKTWRKAPFWPQEFVKKTVVNDDSDEEEESKVGRMPTSDDENDT